MPLYPASIDLSSLNGATGFSIGVETVGDRSGFSVSSAGDVNGDGLDDLVIGAPYANPNGQRSGATYVVFGSATGFGSNLDLSGLDGSNGFKLNGQAAGNESGWSVASAGDVNGDGIGDIIIGAPSFDINGLSTGASYVVFGKASGFAPTLDLSSLNGSNGFRINGESAFDSSGASVASAGDVNGDGFDDLIIGAVFHNSNVHYSGAAYVVFGKASGLPASFDLSGLDGQNGFKLSGTGSNYNVGGSVASAGDVNGDGFDDLVISASGHNAIYVVFGKAVGFAANIDLPSLNGTDGFVIPGQPPGQISVASAGDINGDGIADLIIGENNDAAHGNQSGASYVVFGSAAGFGPTLQLSSLDGSNGFKISGVAAYDRSGASVASAGDVNGDGFDDLIVGATGADPHGVQSGAAYLVFGKASGFAANLDLSALDGTNGVALNGVATYDRSGHSVASAGDFNGDGFDDVVVGSWGYNSGAGAAAAHVMFGRSPATPVTLTGTGGSDSLVGGNQDDAISGLGGDDRLIGHGGNDSIAGGPGDDTLDGGSGNDVLDGGSGNNTASYQSAASAVMVSLALQGAAQHTQGAGDDILSNIQNLIGSNFNDDLSGNANANVLHGAAGADTLRGQAGDDAIYGETGNDYIEGGDGNDVIDGGAGFNVAAYATASHFVVVDLTMQGAWQDTQGAGADLITNIESLVGSNFDDNLAGDGQVNALYGGNGNDTLYGRGDDDNLFGQAGNDYIEGGDGNDVIDGGAGFNVAAYATASHFVVVDLSLQGLWQDTQGAGVDFITNVENLIGSAFDDTLSGDGQTNVIYGGNGDDRLWGGGGDDNLFGQAGNDVIEGGDGNDVIDGGAGSNIATYFFASHFVVLDLNMQGIWQDTQGAGNDLITNVEGLIGSDFNDNLTGDAQGNFIDGGAGADTIYGMAGNDTIVGGIGADYIDGGTGDDTLTGFFDADAFVFGANFGHDTITDFTASGAGHDRILLLASMFADFAAVQSHMTQSGSDVVISDGVGDTITLSHLLTTDLTSGDFTFV